MAAAKEISHLLRFPGASKIDTFADGRVRLIKFALTEQQGLDGVAIREIPTQLKSDILVCAVERDGGVIIPNGNFVLKNGDQVTFLATQEKAHEFFQRIHMPVRPVRNALIVGGGAIAYYLSQELLENHIRVRIVERDPARCNVLAESLPEAQILERGRLQPRLPALGGTGIHRGLRGPDQHRRGERAADPVCQEALQGQAGHEDQPPRVRRYSGGARSGQHRLPQVHDLRLHRAVRPCIAERGRQQHQDSLPHPRRPCGGAGVHRPRGEPGHRRAAEPAASEKEPAALLHHPRRPHPHPPRRRPAFRWATMSSSSRWSTACTTCGTSWKGNGGQNV